MQHHSEEWCHGCDVLTPNQKFAIAIFATDADGTVEPCHQAV